MTLPAWDLDAPVDPAPVARRSAGPGPALLTAIGLTALGLGALTGSALTPTAAPRSPVTATLNLLDAYVDTSAPAPDEGPSAAPRTGPRPRIGDAVAVFRLQVNNSEARPVRVTALDLDGVTRRSDQLPLDLRVAGYSSASADITLHPDCSAGRDPAAVRAWLRLTDADGSDPTRARITPSRPLAQFGGLCSRLDTELPNGWRSPLQAISARTVGVDLELVLEDLSGAQLAGSVLNGQLLPTVFVGEQILSTTALLKPGENSTIRFKGPAPCIEFGAGEPIPSTVRLLAESDQGLAQRLVVVGPALPRWLRLDCAER